MENLKYNLQENGNPNWDCDFTPPNINIELVSGQGDAGYTAYEIAVQQGFVGTKDEWLLTLVQPALDAQEDADALMTEFQENEDIRQDNEDTRILNEDERIRLENIRIDNETERVRIEALRVTTEENRDSKETERLNAELDRISAENIRISNEIDRIAREQITLDNETERIRKEDIRITNELERIRLENIRKSDELTRQQQESTRQQQEANRNTTFSNSQEARTTAFNNSETARQNTFNTNEAIRNVNEFGNGDDIIGRVDAEAQRRADELLRQATIAGLNTTFNTKIDKTAIKEALGHSSTDVMSQKATTDAIMKSYNYDVNQLAYGVRLDLTSDGKTLVRVGNLSLHKTRPITSKAKNCVKNVVGVNYYLSNDTDLLKADGVTPSILDGTDGDVMKEIPELYVREYTEGNYAYTYISEFPLPNFIRIPKTYHGLYEGSYNTTTKQTRSVINATIRTGLPATGQSRSYYNNGARLNRNITWNIDTLLSNYVRQLLFRVDYATYNSQAPYNSQPTAEGYLQGGLGAGVTTLDSRWEWNDYNPFIPCGYTSNLGNKIGVKYFTMPYGYEAFNTTTKVQGYKGVYNQATIYNVGEYVSDKDDTTIGQGDGKLYKCIQQTTAGIPLTNTAYFTEQIRTKVQVNRFLVEMPFGHTFKHTIDSIIELTNAYTTTKCYVYDNPEHYPTSNANDIKTTNARFLCNMPSSEGYAKTFNKYTLVPYAVGGSSNSWCYDYYYWRGEAGGVLRGLLFGGYASSGATAGFGYSSAINSPSYAHAYFGVRLCNFPENIVINS